MAQKSSPKRLPKIEKAELAKPARLEEKSDKAKQDRTRTTWIIVLAFAVLATFAVLVWFVFSGRSDQRINGENLEKLNNAPNSEESSGENK